MILLQTARLNLSRLSETDSAFLIELLNQPSFIRFIGDKNVRNHDDAKRYLREGPDAMFERYGFCLYRMGLKGSDVPVGMCGLLKREQLEAPDIGFAVLSAYEGKGYTTEAAHAVLQYGFDSLGLTRVLGIANPDNAGSHRLLEKLGMRYQGLRPVYPDEPELAWFAIDHKLQCIATNGDCS